MTLRKYRISVYRNDELILSKTFSIIGGAYDNTFHFTRWMRSVGWTFQVGDELVTEWIPA